MTNASRVLSTVCAVALLAVGSACSGGGADKPSPSTASQGKKVDATTAGSLSGSVKFDGAVPPPAEFRLSKDCAPTGNPNQVSDAVIVSSTGALKNAFVYIKDGLDKDYTFDTPTQPVELDQKGCIYTPRVFGVMVGQPLDVVNEDATLHNVHALPMVNQEFNKSQPQQNSHMLHTFTAPEVMVKFMCNVHQWMAAYVGVVPHPYFAVSDADGNFTIKDVPPGTYTIEAWHEKFGRRTANVTIAGKQAQTVGFTFTAADAK